MKFKKLLKLLDPIGDIIIWSPDDEEEPEFQGSIIDIPWYFLNYKIGRPNFDKEESIWIADHISENDKRPALVIHLIPPDYKKGEVV